MADSGNWILKIISGPHQGAEVAQHPGRLVAGTDAECDLVLHDVLVAPRHFALTLQKDVITLEPLEGPVFCNGKRVTAPTPVPAFGFVTAGTTHLVLGPAHARWPLISIADVPVPEKDPLPAAAATADKASAPNASEPATDPKAPKPPTRDQRRRALWTAGIGGVLLIAWLVLWFMWTPHSAIVTGASVRERAERTLRAHPEAAGVRLEQQGERFVATGFVASDVLQRTLSNALRDDAPEVTVRIWSISRMVETARSVLAERALDLTVAPGDAGELTFKGNVRSREEWTRVRQQILAEVSGLQRLNDTAVVALPPPAKKRVGPAPIATVPVVTPTPAPVALLESSEAVSVLALHELGAGQGWVRLSNGAVYFRGARLPDGARVSAIRDGKVVVDKAGTTLELSVGAELAAGPRPPVPAEVAAGTTSLPSSAAAAQNQLPHSGEKTAGNPHLN